MVGAEESLVEDQVLPICSGRRKTLVSLISQRIGNHEFLSEKTLPRFEPVAVAEIDLWCGRP